MENAGYLVLRSSQRFRSQLWYPLAPPEPVAPRESSTRWESPVTRVPFARLGRFSALTPGTRVSELEASAMAPLSAAIIVLQETVPLRSKVMVPPVAAAAVPLAAAAETKR